MLAALLAASCAQAFDSRAWLEARNDDSCVKRLQTALLECRNKGDALPAEYVTLPIERFDNGRVRTRIYAEKAWVFPKEDFILAEGVHVTRLKEDLSVDIDFTAAGVIVDRKTKEGWVEGQAEIHTPGVTASGCGVYISFENETARVLSRTRIVLPGLKLDPRRILHE